MNYQDARGEEMSEWIATNNLIEVNQGKSPTFEHNNYDSILDLKISSENIRRYISSWNVINEETPNDYKYILFEVLENSETPETILQHQGWRVKKLDQ